MRFEARHYDIPSADMNRTPYALQTIRGWVCIYFYWMVTLIIHCIRHGGAGQRRIRPGVNIVFHRYAQPNFPHCYRSGCVAVYRWHLYGK